MAQARLASILNQLLHKFTFRIVKWNEWQDGMRYLIYHSGNVNLHSWRIRRINLYLIVHKLRHCFCTLLQMLIVIDMCIIKGCVYNFICQFQWHACYWTADNLPFFLSRISTKLLLILWFTTHCLRQTSLIR